MCARKSAAAISDRITARTAVHDVVMENEPWDGLGRRQKRSWRHVVLTSPAPLDLPSRFEPTVLRSNVHRVRKAVPRFWRMTPWGKQRRDDQTGRKRSRRDTSYIAGEEIAPGGMVHVHLLIYGEFVLQKRLQELWSRALGEQAFIWATAIRGGAQGIARALREVLKYATKGEKGIRASAERAAAVEVAFRNIKRLSIGGALRKIRIADCEGRSEDAKPEDLHASRQMQCCVCGERGSWLWGGRVAAEIVEHNGGYGPVVGEAQALPNEATV